MERGECLRDKLSIPHGTRFEICRSVHAEQNAIINAARSGTSLYGGTMYFYAENGKGEKVDSFPCYICKKMIINAGLEWFVGSTKKGDIARFDVSEWIADWRTRDILDDKYQYGKDQNESMP